MNHLSGLPKGLNPHPYEPKKIFIDWCNIKTMRGRMSVLEMLSGVGDKLRVVFTSSRSKHGIKRCVNTYQRRTGKLIRFNIMTAHLCELEFIGRTGG